MVSSIHLLQFVSFLDLLAVGLLIPLISGHVRELGASHIHVGLLGSIYAAFQLGSGPLIGSLSDLKGGKRILIYTLLLSSICYIIIGFTSSVLLILVMRGMLGLFKQTQTLTKALVPDFEKNNIVQSQIYGKMAAISGAGITLGPMIGGHIAEDFPERGFTLIASFVGLLFILNAGIICMLPTTPTKHKIEKKKDKESQENIMQYIRSSLKQSVIELFNVDWANYWDIFLLKALVGLAMGIYYSNYSLYLKTQFDLTPKYIGRVISFQGVIGSLSSFFIGYINSYYKSDKDYSLRNMHVFLLTSISILGIIMSFSIYVYVLWLIPLAMGNAVGRLTTLEMVLHRSKSEHRGTLIGASGSIRSLAGVVAPLVSGVIGQYIGVPYVIYASLVFTLTGTVLSYYFRRKIVKVD